MSNNSFTPVSRIMAIDFGDARTGVAVSDESASIAGDAWVIHEKRVSHLVNKIIEEVVNRGVGTIVVGYPRNMDGSAGFRAAKTDAFVEELRNLLDTTDHGQPNLSDIDIKLWDERLTSKMANNILGNAGKMGKKRKSSVDAVAAALILESYIAGIGG